MLQQRQLFMHCMQGRRNSLGTGVAKAHMTVMVFILYISCEY